MSGARCRILNGTEFAARERRSASSCLAALAPPSWTGNVRREGSTQHRAGPDSPRAEEFPVVVSVGRNRSSTASLCLATERASERNKRQSTTRTVERRIEIRPRERARPDQETASQILALCFKKSMWLRTADVIEGHRARGRREHRRAGHQETRIRFRRIRRMCGEPGDHNRLQAAH